MAWTLLIPGFRFHPTDVELVWYFLRRKIIGRPSKFEVISEVDLYKFAPWDLPAKSCLRTRDLEWFFFCPRDKKYSQGSRTNRATDIGYWKTTGKDRPILHNAQTVGMKKTLIFHVGKAPQGSRTDWVMYEFRLVSDQLASAGYAQDAYVICKIFQKSGPGPRNGEEHGAPFKEEDWDDDADFEGAAFLPSTFVCEFGATSSTVSNFEVGEPSSVVNNLDVGGPSSGPCNIEVGEPSSSPCNVEVGEPSCAPMDIEVREQSIVLSNVRVTGSEGLPSVPEMSSIGESSAMGCLPGIEAPPFAPELSYADGISLEEIEAFLNSSPTQPGIADNETSNLASLDDDAANLSLLFDLEDSYRNLTDLAPQPFLEPTEGIAPLGNTVYDRQNPMTDFANEEYLSLNDFGFGDPNRGQLVPYDYHYPAPDCRPYDFVPNHLANIPYDGLSEAQITQFDDLSDIENYLHDGDDARERNQ